MIQIIYGSIFDSKCDLLIVPCDSAGGVTGSVYKNLFNRGLMTRIGNLSYGMVYFVSEMNYEFASTVGYAASVEVKSITSDSKAIGNIANQIVRYSTENQIRIVNIPLLGSGAGGMLPSDSFKTLREVFKNIENITFNIFCFEQEVYKEVLSLYEKSGIEKKSIRSPRVFISYTGLDDENVSWVKNLATVLRKNGIDARLDIFHLKPGTDLPQWMTNEIIKADKVLLICDKHYIEKADFKKGGVGWETMIIQGDMLSQADNKQKYIAIICEDEVDNALPIYMKSKYAFKWGNNKDISKDNLEKLIMSIFDCDTEPELGEIPPYVLEKINNK